MAEHIAHRDANATAAIHGWTTGRSMLCRQGQKQGRVFDVQPVANLVASSHEDIVVLSEFAGGVPKKLFAQAASVYGKKAHDGDRGTELSSVGGDHFLGH